MSVGWSLGGAGRTRHRGE